MAKFLMQPLIGNVGVTARLGATATANDRFNDSDVNKLVKLGGDSRYVLCASGDPIEGRVNSVDTATADGYSTGSVNTAHGDRFYATADGSQAAGTGALAVGDFVVAGAPAALGTAEGALGPKVRKATQQPGVTEAAAVGDVNDQIKVALFACRVVSLGTVGTGAVGTQVVVERL